MKTIFTLILLVPILLFGSTEKEIDSKIENVTVFFKGAQINRSAKISLAAGNYEIVISGIENNIDNNSIQVRGNGDYLIKSYYTRRNYLKKVDLTDEIRDLEKQFSELVLQVEELNLDRSVLQDEESLILKNQNLAGQQSGMNIEQLKQTSLFYQTRLKEIRKSILDIDRKIKDNQKKQQQIRNQVAQMRSIKQESVNQLVLNIDVNKSTSGKLDISYYVPNASWVPFYEVMVDEVNKPIQLVYKANVNQNTGIEWKDVNLTLSTIQPNLSGQVPTLSPWYLTFSKPEAYTRTQNDYAPRTKRMVQVGSGAQGKIYGNIRDGQTGETLPYANVVALDANGNTVNGGVSDFDGNYSFTVNQRVFSLQVSFIGYQTEIYPINGNRVDGYLYGDATELMEVVVQEDRADRGYVDFNKEKSVYQTSVISQKATFFEYNITSPYTIASDNLPETVHIRDVEVQAKYEYQCVPKLDKDVFLVARIYGWEEFNLLNGDARLYFEKTFVGKSFLNVELIEDTLGLSLGRDKNIIVTRDKAFDESGVKTFSGNKKETRMFSIQMRNNKKEEINLMIRDQYPLSNEKRISVKLEESSDAKVEETTGTLVWRIPLIPSENKKVDFGYSVSYPQEFYVTLPE